MRLRIAALAVGVVLVGSLTGWAQSPLGIVIEPTDQLQISVQMDRGKFGAVYAIGERARIFFTATTTQAVPCVWVYLFDIDAAGVVRQIFPNAFSANNCVRPGVQHVVPDLPTYQLVVAPPTGTEFVQAFASLQPLNLGTLGSGQFPLVGQSPEEARQLLLGAIQGLIPGQIATDVTSFQVVGGPAPGPTNRPPVACFTFTPPAPVVGQTVFFDAGCSFDPDFGDLIAQFLWDLDGDGFFETSGRTASRAFFTPGGHLVRLQVFDSRGAAGTTSQTVFVGGAPPPPAPTTFGFFIDALSANRFRISVQGDSSWFVPRPFRILLETDGQFTSVAFQTTGNASPLGLVPTPTPVPTSTLDLRGQVGAGGRIDYTIAFSGATKIKFDLRLDINGDGSPERAPTSRILIGPTSINPFSNPFVLHFPSGSIAPIFQVQICITLVDQPGFRFIICFRFGS